MAGRPPTGLGDVESTFYSDSMNDVPLLEKVDHPVATNPDPRLRALAQERGWRINELFADDASSRHCGRVSSRPELRPVPVPCLLHTHDQEVHRQTAGQIDARNLWQAALRQARRGFLPRCTASTPSWHGARPMWCNTLKDAGYEVYIVVVPCARPLPGLRPADFDVATNATPGAGEGALFRRAFIIGKRSHRARGAWPGPRAEVTEVSTFRAYLDNSAAGQVSGNERPARLSCRMQHAVEASGRVLRDNVWGP